MERLKVKEFKTLSKSLGLKGCYKLNKPELVKLVSDELKYRWPICKPPPGPPARPPKPTRPPPSPPPKFKPYQLKDKGSTIGDVQPPKNERKSKSTTFDPKKLKRMKRDLAELNKKIRQSRKKQNNLIHKRNNLKKVIDEMIAAKPHKQLEVHKFKFKELAEAFGRTYRSLRCEG